MQRELSGEIPLIHYDSAGSMAVLVGHPFDLVKVSVFFATDMPPLHKDVIPRFISFDF